VLVNAGKTFGGVVAFECHEWPGLSWEKERIAISTPIPMFCFAQAMKTR